MRISRIEKSAFCHANVTPQSLIVAAEMTGHASIITTESDYIDLTSGRAFDNKTGNVEPMLKAWSGEDVDYKRVGTGVNIHIKNCKFSIYSATQGEPFDYMMLNSRLKEKGLHSRILAGIFHRNDLGKLIIKNPYRVPVTGCESANPRLGLN